MEGWLRTTVRAPHTVAAPFSAPHWSTDCRPYNAAAYQGAKVVAAGAVMAEVLDGQALGDLGGEGPGWGGAGRVSLTW